MYNASPSQFPRCDTSKREHFGAKLPFNNWKILNSNECDLLLEFQTYLLAKTELFYLDKEG